MQRVYSSPIAVLALLASLYLIDRDIVYRDILYRDIVYRDIVYRDIGVSVFQPNRYAVMPLVKWWAAALLCRSSLVSSASIFHVNRAVQRQTSQLTYQ